MRGLMKTMMRRSRRLLVAVGIGSLIGLGSCQDDPARCDDATGVGCPTSEGGAIVSDPALLEGPSLTQRRVAHSAVLSFTAQVTPGESDVAYISLSSGSFPEGVFARIQSSRSEGTVTAPMIEGGLDPVPINALAGDSVEIDILSSDFVTLNRTGKKVPATRRPKVVRTVPPRGKTDVAVNTNIVVIFSEPINANSLSSSSIRLLRSGTPVTGTARLLQGVTAAVVFQPSEALSPSTSYQLVVTQGILDLDGEPLEADVTVDFTLGTEFAPEVSQLTVFPNISAVAIGSQVQLLVRATAGDDTIRIPLPIAGVPILWSSENPSVAMVSTTGLVTARTEGEVRIRAQVLSDANISAASVVLVSASQAPVASVEVSSQADTTPVTGKIELTALTRDAGGSALQFRPVAWTASNTSVATVEPDAGGRAWVTGVAPGRVSVIATSEGRADTVTIDVVNPGPYATMSAGTGDPTCGLRAAGWAFCWGANASGQVGDGTSNRFPVVPRAVVGAMRFSELSTGNHNTCAVTAQGEAHCWGLNALGGLGIGTTSGPELCQFAGTCSRRPVAVSGGLRFAEIDVGRLTGVVCGLTTTGAVYCWGDNSTGTLGTGSTTGPEACSWHAQFPQPCSTVPVAVAGGRSYTSLALGGAHACALTPTGEVYCWGDNGYGQLGDGTIIDRPTPVAVAGGLEFTAVSAGSTHTCALTADGAAYCWGENRTGALGTGDVTGPDSCPNPFGGPTTVPCSRTPVPGSQSLTWSSISLGDGHTCALDEGGAAYCWGQNDRGQLGTGNTQNSASSTAVVGGLSFANLTAGGPQTCGVSRTTSVAYCWGYFAAIGSGGDTLQDSTVPVRVPGQP